MEVGGVQKGGGGRSHRSQCLNDVKMISFV